MTSVLPRAAAPRAPIGSLAHRAMQTLRSRVVWFVMERYSAAAFGFLLTASLTRGAQLDRLAEYLAAFALTSVFEPLFAASIGSYLLKVIRLAETPALADQTFRSIFWTMQGVAILFVGAAFALCLALPGDHLITALFFLQIVFTPWKLFTAPLIARDQFMRVIPVQVSANIVAGVVRVGVALATHNLYLIPVLMCLEAVIAGPIIKSRAGVKLLNRAPLSKEVTLTLARQLPALMGVMVLVCLFYRSPVMLAHFDLGAAAVVRIALAMQVVTAFGVIQAALADSLIGPLAHALDTDTHFMKLLSMGSAVQLVYGLAVCLLLWAFGQPLLSFAFGRRADMVGPIIAAVAPLCLLSGLARLTNTVINLRARPVLMVIIWGGALVGQGVAALLLLTWRSAFVVAVMMPVSLVIGLCLALLFGGARRYVAEVMFGFRRIVLSPSQWPAVMALMLGGRSEAARASAG